MLASLMIAMAIVAIGHGHSGYTLGAATDCSV